MTSNGGSSSQARNGVAPPAGRQALSPLRSEAVVAAGEFCGTFMFLLPGFIAVQIAMDTASADPPAVAKVLYIAATFGASLAVNVWIFYLVSGGQFNPAVTLGLLVAGAVTWKRAVIVAPLQILAGMCAAAVADALLPGPSTVSTLLGNGMSTSRGLFLEMFLTAQLMLPILFLAVEKQKATFLAPIGIGVALFIDHLAGVYWTGASMNPARSFGPAVIEGFPRYHWIYWLGPCMGSCLAAGLYRGLKAMHYELANPTQDFNSNDMAAYDTQLDSSMPLGGSRAAVKDSALHHVQTASPSHDGPAATA